MNEPDDVVEDRPASDEGTTVKPRRGRPPASKNKSADSKAKSKANGAGFPLPPFLLKMIDRDLTQRDVAENLQHSLNVIAARYGVTIKVEASELETEQKAAKFLFDLHPLFKLPFVALLPLAGALSYKQKVDFIREAARAASAPPPSPPESTEGQG